MRIAVSPDYRHYHYDELRLLEVRAEDLDCIVSTYQSGYDRIVRVRRGSKMTKLRGEGPLSEVIAAALDDFEETFGEPWAPEEILQVAEQSGLDVRRA